jgi:hypothetical protein
MCYLNATELVWAKLKGLVRANSAMGDMSYQALALLTEHAMYTIYLVTKEGKDCGCHVTETELVLGTSKTVCDTSVILLFLTVTKLSNTTSYADVVTTL